MSAEIQTEMFSHQSCVKSIFLHPAQNTEYAVPCFHFPQTHKKEKKPKKSSLLIVPLSFIRQIKVMLVATTTQTEKKQSELSLIIIP